MMYIESHLLHIVIPMHATHHRRMDGLDMLFDISVNSNMLLTLIFQCNSQSVLDATARLTAAHQHPI